MNLLTQSPQQKTQQRGQAKQLPKMWTVTVGSASLLARGGDNVDNIDDGDLRYEAPVAGDAVSAHQVGRQLGHAVLDR